MNIIFRIEEFTAFRVIKEYTNGGTSSTMPQGDCNEEEEAYSFAEALASAERERLGVANDDETVVGPTRP